ncbi:hypothetical protein OE88DRAFT_694845 [Heliocybe sulcata]|uniref:Uncharacterized protein n=1 Tax=Heliocybe sulcata TaxID=5364 RepID=A0A5C3NGL5_9AGAM|nr:hypothetical protein OE88DRAFT_694845 [Heliocybe sulcata]
MGFDFLQTRSQRYPPVTIVERGVIRPAFSASRASRPHPIPEYGVDDDYYDYDHIPQGGLPDKSGPSRLRTSLSYCTISSHLTSASTSSSSSSDLEPPYPPTPLYTDSFPDTPSSASRSSLDSRPPLPFDVSPLEPKRKPWSGRGSQDSQRSMDDGFSQRPPVYARESPTSIRRPLPLLPISPTSPRQSSAIRPLPIPVEHPPPYAAAIQSYSPPDHRRKSIRPLPKVPPRQRTAAPRPDLSAVSPPQLPVRKTQEEWASAEEGLRQVPVTEVIDWDAVEEAMLDADSDDHGDSDSTIGPG